MGNWSGCSPHLALSKLTSDHVWAIHCTSLDDLFLLKMQVIHWINSIQTPVLLTFGGQPRPEGYFKKTEKSTKQRFSGTSPSTSTSLRRTCLNVGMNWWTLPQLLMTVHLIESFVFHVCITPYSCTVKMFSNMSTQKCTWPGKIYAWLDNLLQLFLPLNPPSQQLSYPQPRGIPFSSSELWTLITFKERVCGIQWCDAIWTCPPAEPVPDCNLDKSERDVFYLPCMPSKRTTTKTCAVFDASTKTSSGVSLNYCGPQCIPPSLTFSFIFVCTTLHSPLIWIVP